MSMLLGLKPNEVKLTDHDPNWKIIAAKTIQKLWQIFGSVANDIQHIGSTSIKNIMAKPMIDIAVAVDDFVKVEGLSMELERNGFLNRGFPFDEHMMFTVTEGSPDSPVKTHNIHIVKIDSASWRDFINFRNYLNTHPSVAESYEALKIKLASEYTSSMVRKQYQDSKRDFIEQILLDAQRHQA